MTRRTLGFVIVGAVAAIINVLARIAFNTFVPFEVAIALAFVVALTVAFTLNRRHIFEATDGPLGTQYTKFAIVNLLALAQVWLISVGLAHHLFPAIGMTWQPETVAHAVGVVSPVVTSFLAYKHFVFAEAPANKP